MRRKLFFILLSLTTFINTSSCITPPPGRCAFNNDYNKQGTINIISIEKYQSTELEDVNCKDRQVVKFNFISDFTDAKKIYSEDFPGDYLKENKIESGKTYKGVKIFKFTGPCPDELYTFTDFEAPLPCGLYPDG